MIYQFLFFFRSQVQGLFPDVAIVQQVFRKEVFVFRCSKPVVRFAKGETKDEVGRLKTEQTVVEYHIDALPTVFITDGCMSEEGIDFLAGATGQQAETDAVILGLHLLFCCLQRVACQAA